MQGAWQLDGLHHNRLVGGVTAKVQGPVHLHMANSFRVCTAPTCSLHPAFETGSTPATLRWTLGHALGNAACHQDGSKHTQGPDTCLCAMPR